ncbi:hypothetical protein ACF0H5_021889 [Mactra antiquata]
MSSAENDQTTDSSHENNLYADRQLQNKLLQLEEDSDNEAYDQRLSRSWSNLKGTTKSHKTVDSITGWFPNSKFVGRKNELQRPETKPAFIHPWKDYRSRGKEDSFVFKHYTECRKYIEQYRIEHGCHVNRFPSGNQIGDMRRIAFQGSAPPQHSPISVQQMQQSGYSSITPQPPSSNQHSSLHYANRKEQLGTLITGTNGSVSNKTNYIEPSSHAQKYRVNNSKLPRNNTVYDMRNQDSDNSSDCGDIRLRSPSRRSNSASSQRAKSRNITKSPTKITVPASPSTRSYPLQALTIQQNCKPDVCPSPKPLDNLNCVAPEKQSNNNNSEKKSLEPNLELALRVHSLNDLLIANDAPLRGYALPKSLPPNPNNNNNNMWFDASGRAYVSLATRYDPVKKY